MIDVIGALSLGRRHNTCVVLPYETSDLILTLFELAGLARSDMVLRSRAANDVIQDDVPSICKVS